MELDGIDLPAGAEATVSPHPVGGVRLEVKFGNGYGASVIKTPASNGVELAVLAYEQATGESRLVYDTPVTEDVAGWIESPAELVGHLRTIAELGQRFEYVKGDVRFVWKRDASAAYIHLYWTEQAFGEPVPFEVINVYDYAAGGEPVPFEVINVYDYAAGEVQVATFDQFKAACEEWLSELEPGELDNYRKHTLDLG